MKTPTTGGIAIQWRRQNRRMVLRSDTALRRVFMVLTSLLGDVDREWFIAEDRSDHIRVIDDRCLDLYSFRHRVVSPPPPLSTHSCQKRSCLITVLRGHTLCSNVRGYLLRVLPSPQLEGETESLVILDPHPCRTQRELSKETGALQPDELQIGFRAQGTAEPPSKPRQFTQWLTSSAQVPRGRRGSPVSEADG